MHAVEPLRAALGVAGTREGPHDLGMGRLAGGELGFREAVKPRDGRGGVPCIGVATDDSVVGVDVWTDAEGLHPAYPAGRALDIPLADKAPEDIVVHRHRGLHPGLCLHGLEPLDHARRVARNREAAHHGGPTHRVWLDTAALHLLEPLLGNRDVPCRVAGPQDVVAALEPRGQSLGLHALEALNGSFDVPGVRVAPAQRSISSGVGLLAPLLHVCYQPRGALVVSLLGVAEEHLLLLRWVCSLAARDSLSSARRCRIRGCSA
mmetsp:Transcript_13011/g.35703  ORF Transcript_13011/g.35703 Transcript_13011/m.35703 type:complete len:263 (-) Transcript_13011:316-1104(-)